MTCPRSLSGRCPSTHACLVAGECFYSPTPTPKEPPMLTPANLAAIQAVHARIPAAGNLPGGWMEAYRQDVGALLAEVERLRADGDEMQRAAELAAEAENANAVELATVKAERDALRAEVARLRVSLAATDEGLRAELDRLRSALAAAHREIAEDDEGYAGVDE